MRHLHIGSRHEPAAATAAPMIETLPSQGFRDGYSH